MQANKKKNNKEQFRQRILDKAHIPEDNVIDLSKMLYREEEELAKAKKEEKYPHLLKNLFQSFKRKKKPEKTAVPGESFGLTVQWRGLATFTLLCLALIIPILLFVGFQRIDQVKGRVLGASVLALENLKSAGQAMTDFDISEARDRFEGAERSFLTAQKELKTINGTLLALIKIIPFKGETLTSGEHLIYAGRNIAEIGKVISEKIEPLTSSDLALEEGSLAVPQVLFNLEGSLDTISKKIDNTKWHLEKVKAYSLPEEYRSEIKKVQELIPSLDDYFEYLRRVFKVSLSLLGQEGTREYLLIFQNNQELRATGGFIGSLALISIEKGNVRILEVPGRGPYEINDDFELNIVPPKPLWLINNKWQIQDANWFPDFEASARKINWFYEKARGFNVDGIISFTPGIITELLDITGPITMDKYETVLSSDNFIQQTQREVENEYEKELNKPKQIIADLMPLLLNKVLQSKPSDFFEVLNVFNVALLEKDILIYSEDENVEKELKELGLAGEIKKAEKDFLMVVDTNIGGGKTDGVINESIVHQAQILGDGSIINTLKIKRTHEGGLEDEFTKVKNLDYMRVYVPEGSILIEASGFSKIDQNLILYPEEEAMEDEDLLNIEKDPIIHEKSNTRITREFGKTVFANWLGLEVGESREVIIKYKLPFKITEAKDIYSLYIQKQPGSGDAQIRAELVLPDNFNILEQTPKGLDKGSNTLQYNDRLNKDKAYGVILGKE